MSDLEEILQVFYNTVHSINAKDYSKSQLDAWGVKNPDKQRWLDSLERNISYVAELNGKIIGFGDLNDKKYIDRLYTHKDYQGIGVASKILDALEQEAIKLGYPEVYTEASITAKLFFLNRKYNILQPQNKYHNGQVFINYIMIKKLL
jgi:N-acetylglutamate synthase and related acetyltransferases